MARRRRGLAGELSRLRGGAWNLQRALGNIIPWVELDALKILRREARRRVLRAELVRGGGPWGSWLGSGAALILRGLLGLNRD